MTTKDRIALIKELRELLALYERAPHLAYETTVSNAKKLLNKTIGQELTNI